MSHLAAFGIGLWMFVLPMLYVLGVFALWAKIEGRIVRNATVLLAVLLAGGFAHYRGFFDALMPDEVTVSAVDEFADLCANHVSGQPLAAPREAKTVTLVGGSGEPGSKNPNVLGRQILPGNVMASVALGEERRFEAYKGFGQFYDENGRNLARHASLASDDFDIGLTWEVSGVDDSGLYASLTLRVIDLRTDESLGVQPAYAWLGRPNGSVLFPLAIQNRASHPMIRTCPEPVEIVRFIKQLARPPIAGATDD